MQYACSKLLSKMAFFNYLGPGKLSQSVYTLTDITYSFYLTNKCRDVLCKNCDFMLYLRGRPLNFWWREWVIWKKESCKVILIILNQKIFALTSCKKRNFATFFSHQIVNSKFVDGRLVDLLSNNGTYVNKKRRKNVCALCVMYGLYKFKTCFNFRECISILKEFSQ